MIRFTQSYVIQICACAGNFYHSCSKGKAPEKGAATGTFSADGGRPGDQLICIFIEPEARGATTLQHAPRARAPCSCFKSRHFKFTSLTADGSTHNGTKIAGKSHDDVQRRRARVATRDVGRLASPPRPLPPLPTSAPTASPSRPASTQIPLPYPPRRLPGRADSCIRGSAESCGSAAAAHVALVERARVGGGERVCLVRTVERGILAQQEAEVVGTHLGVPCVGGGLGLGLARTLVSRA